MTKGAGPLKALAAITTLLLLVAAVAGYRGVPLRKLPALDLATSAWPEDTFRSGAWFAPMTEVPAGLSTRGSRVGDGGYRGTFTSGWFAARPHLALLVAGFPTLPGNSLAVEVRDSDGHLTSLPFDHVQPRDSWRPWRITLPPSAVAFRLHAVDGSEAPDGWLAVSEPFEPRFWPVLWAQAERAFAALVVQVLLFAVLTLLVARVLPRAFGSAVAPTLLPALALAGVALLGYVAFWLYFAHPLAGRIFSWALAATACVALLIRAPRFASLPRGWSFPLLLAVVAGVFYLALLVLHEPPRLSFAAQFRFVDGMPSDNEIPRAFAERLGQGESPRQLWGDWLSSDRPPLQSGWLLLTWPMLQALGFDADTLSATGGLCFQLLWIPAVFALAVHLGATTRQALALAAALSFTGVLMLFSVFVWPKLAAAALMLTAFLLWFAPASEGRRTRFALGGACAALGWLAHGGVAFSLLGVAPLALLCHRRVPWRAWLPAALAFAAIAFTWVGYQRLYEPPGNRLLKMHLAGVPGIDARGVVETLRDSYREIGLHTALTHKLTNLAMQAGGDWSHFWRYDTTGDLNGIRYNEVTYSLRACAWWLFALPLGLAAWVRTRRAASPFSSPSSHLTSPAPPALLAALWLASGLVVWLALMFLPNVASIHQGTLVTQLLAFTLLAWGAFAWNRWAFAVLATLQAGWFLLVWTSPLRSPMGSLLLLPASLGALAAAALLGLIWSTAATSAASAAKP